MGKVSAVISLTLVLLFALSAVPFKADKLFTPVTEAKAETEDVLLTLERWSDTHIGSKNAQHYLENGVDTINSEENKADGIIVSGDLTTDGAESEYRSFYEIMSKINGPKLVTANGNHDSRTGVKMQWMVDIMLEKGVTDAFNLDGGRTTLLYFMGQAVNKKENVNRDAMREVTGLIGFGARE